jgi:hypothetical protein
MCVLSMCLSAGRASFTRGADPAGGDLADGQQHVDFFERRIRPLLIDNCHKCHSSERQESNLRLDSREAMIRGGDIGAAIVPGRPEESLLVDAVRHGEIVQMPPQRKLTARQIDDLVNWIEIGAPWPGDQEAKQAQRASESVYRFTDEDKEFWAFVPVRDRELPQVRDEKWCANGVDHFVLAKLEEQGLQPSPAADRYTLLRRVTFDLTGLPPTPSEIHDFIDDTSPQAYEAVVERLLNSPRYGEQWGRHWLDVVRFAEGAGGDSDWVYRGAWRYRDYVIEAFNTDKPYDEFIVEQLAGDLLPKSGDADLDLKRHIATGFLHVGPRPLAERDKKQMMLEIVDEQLNATGVAFMGLTLGCARCHDHKFDPIPARDYYAMAGIFMSTRTLADKTTDSQFLEYEVPDADGRPLLIMAATDENHPVDMKVHNRGSYKSLGDVAPRGFLGVIAGDVHAALPDDGSGRLQLARWIANRDHPLTARVAVNRIWQRHFGAGLVASSGNFGRQGARPSHPELLDWLASRFIESGWSVKDMHRLMLLSNAYRQAAAENGQAQQIDPDNRLLWRMNRRRLTAEEIRDSMLAVSGELDLTAGGSMLLYRDGWGRPRRYPKEDGIYDRPIYGFRIRHERYPPFERPRRSVYLPQVRSVQSEFSRLFDGPEIGVPMSQRGESTVAPQSLFFMNSDFVNEQSLALAQKLSGDCGSTSCDGSLRRAFVLLLGRPAEESEVRRGRNFLAAYERDIHRTQPAGSGSERYGLVWYERLVRETPGLIAYYRLNELHEFHNPLRPHTAVNSACPGTADGKYRHHMKWKKPGGGFYNGLSFSDNVFGRWGALSLETAAGRRNTAVGFNIPYEWPFDDDSDTGVNRGHRVQVDDVTMFNTATGELSVEYWLQPIIAPWTGTVVGRDDGINNRIFRSGIQEATIDGRQANVVYYEIFGEGNGGLRTGDDARFVAQPARWSHVAFTYGGGRRRLYLNGRLIDEATVSVTLPSGDVPLTIGSRPDEQDWFAGMVDEVAVYDRVLEPETINVRIAAASGELERATRLAPHVAAWAAYCQTLLSTNEFIFID